MLHSKMLYSLNVVFMCMPIQVCKGRTWSQSLLYPLKGRFFYGDGLGPRWASMGSGNHD